MGNRRKGGYDHDEGYREIEDAIAKASGEKIGRGSRASDPLYDELLDTLYKKIEKLEEKYEELSSKQESKPRPPEQKTASYRIGVDLKTRVDKAANRYNMNKGDFVYALLTYALDRLEAGSLKLPTEIEK